MAAQVRAKKQTDCQMFSLTLFSHKTGEKLAYMKVFKESTVSSQSLAVVYVKARKGKKTQQSCIPQEGSCSKTLDM